MASSKLKKSRSDSTTLFVSLSLCMLVLFAFLNATALPSKTLLNNSLDTPTAILPVTNQREVGIPEDLIDSVRYFKTQGRSLTRPGQLESSILIDRRSLQLDNQGGLDEKKIARLFAWMTDKKRSSDFTAELTCFAENLDNPSDIGSNLYQREQRCRALNIFNEAQLRPTFSARTVPATLQQIATDKHLSIDDMILITLKRQASS